MVILNPVMFVFLLILLLNSFRNLCRKTKSVNFITINITYKLIRYKKCLQERKKIQRKKVK